MPKGEKIIVGTGIMLLGKPRGSIYEGVKPFDIVAYGFGALHIRSHSGKPIRVCVDSGEVTALKLYEMEF
ncbi:hypothetical protein R7P71_17670 [Vibrio sp. 705]|nr:hypothetical protein [Vibrio sp. 705]